MATNSFRIDVPSLGDWDFEDYYEPARDTTGSDKITAEALQLVADTRIGKHKFFRLAHGNNIALIEWAKQECIVTNHFSFALLGLLARIKNVHVRSLLIPVVAGEHSPLRDGYAVAAHPHLLSRLVIDLKINPKTVCPLPFTKRFIDVLFANDHSVPYMLAILGVGNEALLVPEYAAIEEAFERHYPSDIYRPFLRANIEEDTMHSDLMRRAATYLLRSERDRVEYLSGAKAGLAARMSYYDELFDHVAGLQSNGG